MLNDNTIEGNKVELERTESGFSSRERINGRGTGVATGPTPPSSAGIHQQYPLPDKKFKKQHRLASHWYHMKNGGGYLDYMQYYHADEYGETTRILDNCHTSWGREHKGEDIRYRANGCGRRFDCPLCGNYVQSELARDASHNMSIAMTALDVAGIEYENYGLKLIFTIPKETSAWIDDLLFNNTVEWEKEVNRLRKAVVELCRLFFGSGGGYLTCLELTGESNPVEPHYHISVYVFPARYDGDRWYALSSYTDKLNEWRSEWTAVVNGLYNLNLDNADFRYNFIGSEGQLWHWHRYMYRPILADLWNGWIDYDGVMLRYNYWKNHRLNELFIEKEDLDIAFDRARYIPKHFKRIRWAGIFSDGLRAKTMESLLGLERVEKVDENTSEAEGWVRDADVFMLVRYDEDGIVLCDIETKEVFTVPDNFVDYRPDMVRTGRRVKWREPGSGGNCRDENLVLHYKEEVENLVLHMEGGLNDSTCGCLEENE